MEPLLRASHWLCVGAECLWCVPGNTIGCDHGWWRWSESCYAGVEGNITPPLDVCLRIATCKFELFMHVDNLCTIRCYQH